MSVTTPLNIDITDSLVAAAQTEGSCRHTRKGNIQMTCHAVDVVGDYVAGSAGTGVVEVMTVTGTEWESLCEADGSTAVVIDFTAASRTINVFNAPIRAMRVTPDSLAGAGITGICLAVFEIY